jgi:hypothetical protein
MKKLFFISFLITNLASNCYAQHTITITNPSDCKRLENVIEIDWKTLAGIYHEIDTMNLVIINKKTKKEIPFQFEKKGSNQIQNLLIQTDLNPNAKVVLLLKKGNRKLVEPKTYSRYIPERKDDFAWENDKIAFRAYGKALENTKENALGYDVWVKRSTKMIINERYKLGKYHIDNGNGLDYYHVGMSLGAGNIALFKNDTIHYSGNYQSYKILDNGPLRTTFELTYNDLKIGSEKISHKKIITLNAGSYLNKITNSFNSQSSTTKEAVVGIIKRKEKGVVLQNETDGILGYWEPKHEKNGTTGVGVIIPNQSEQMFQKNEQLLAKVNLKDNTDFTYYTGACWDKEGTFLNQKDWFDYLSKYKNELNKQLIINIK